MKSERKAAGVKRMPGFRTRVGFLGGGQLARMLALKAHELGLDPWILCARGDEPAAQVTSHVVIGDINSPAMIKKFSRKVDVLTFESEFVNVPALASASRALSVLASKCQIFPAPSLLAKIQDRRTQKQLMDQYKIATAPWRAIENQEQAELAFRTLGPQIVIKKSFGGYDGYGTYVVKRESDFKRWLKAADFTTTSYIAEKFIGFKREVAVLVARSQAGQIISFPFVETFQSDSKCLWVKGPVQSKSHERLRKKLHRFVADIGYVGVLAFELFEIKNELIVNELAPRVHNSGHYSQDALVFDQFEIHLRCILGQRLPKIKALTTGFAMYNLLGSGHGSLSARSRGTPQKNRSDKSLLKLTDSTHLHWYGKSANIKGRKMGHINAIASSPDKALKLVRQAAKAVAI